MYAKRVREGGIERFESLIREGAECTWQREIYEETGSATEITRQLVADMGRGLR
jgi:hypothetical protein